MTGSPVTNVWSVRKEQMAARSTPLHESSTTPPQPQHSASTPEKSSRQILDPNNQPMSTLPTQNDASPGVHDAGTWPEVGKSMTMAPIQGSDIKEERGGIDIRQLSTTQRKSEKTKWVQIPPEELQAAADAIQSGHKSRSRKASQPGQRVEKPGSSSGSVSGQNSRSGRNSTSQSRIHSQSGSLQSSPRFPWGKRLPTEELAVTDVDGYRIGQGLAAEPSGQGTPPIKDTPPSHDIHHPLHPEYPPSTYSHGVGVIQDGGAYYTHQSHPLVSSQSHFTHSPVQTSCISSSYHPSQTSAPSLSSVPSNLHPNASQYAIHPAHEPPDHAAGQPYTFWNFQSTSGHGSLPYQQHTINPHSSLPHSKTDPSHRSREHGSAARISHQKTTRPPPPQESQAVASYRSLEVVNGFRVEGFKFGSPPDENGYLSPTPSSPIKSVIDVNDLEKSFTTIAIGLSPEDLTPPYTQSRKKRRKSTTIGPMNPQKPPQEKRPSIMNSAIRTIEIGLEAKWEFGTAEAVPSQGIIIAPPEALGTSLATANEADLNDSVSPSLDTHLGTANLQLAEGYPVSPNFDLTEWKARNRCDGLDYDRAALPSSEGGTPVEDGPVSVPDAKVENPGAEVDESRERPSNLMDRPPQADNIRLRRGSYGIGYGDRAGFSGRRGRASFPRGLSRGYGRGYQQSRPPFAVTPPPHFQPIVAINDGSFYPPPRHHLTTYIPTGYENFTAPPPIPTPHITPPVPVPMSPISFPLDPTRWYLLGQLEYYLSPDNMAQDYFLKRQMDAKGWIPISLIASFNRVRRLTTDINLVREVLTLSTLVQVKDDWVRMGGWERYVLPDANPSVVEFDPQPLHVQHYQQEQSGRVHIGIEGGEERDVEEDGEEETEDEEEDVVFVMGQEMGLWVPERQQQI
ncbi:hypothetical protein BD779DRAFT_1673204 [Infundibulicybe gibba]|nr:hypothetical protein BD779DRAFT_1673204 [Infundibulicybe gibba]